MDKFQRTIVKIKKYSGLIRYAFLLVVVLILYLKFFKSKGNTTTGGISSGSVDDIDYSSGNFVLDIGTLKSKVKAILDSMNRLGTDEKTIFQIFNELNRDEINFIFKEFGIVKYDVLGGTASTFIGRKLNLQGWLKNELSNNGSYSYDNLKVILENKGVYLL